MWRVVSGPSSRSFRPPPGLLWTVRTGRCGAGRTGRVSRVCADDVRPRNGGWTTNDRVPAAGIGVGNDTRRPDTERGRHCYWRAMVALDWSAFARRVESAEL